MTHRIVQISDLHLMVDPAARLKDICVRERFELVRAALAAETGRAQRLIVTGDLTHDERAESYAVVGERLTEWREKLRVIPGNHDDRQLMWEAFSDRVERSVERNVFAERLGGWLVVGLDTHVPGSVSGRLGDEQLAWLDDVLHRAAGCPTLLFQHHPPVSLGSPWLDAIDLEDADAYWRLLIRHPQVRVIAAGHVHQESTTQRGSVAVFTTPATGVQFTPESETLVVDTASPGYRVFELGDDGAYRTWVRRVLLPASDPTQNNFPI